MKIAEPLIIGAVLRSKREATVRALVDTGFFGDVITFPKLARRIGVALKYERDRRLPDGRRVRVKYGTGEIEVDGSTTGGDIEVWEKLSVPRGVDALVGVTALEKLGLRLDRQTGRLKMVELFLLGFWVAMFQK